MEPDRSSVYVLNLKRTVARQFLYENRDLARNGVHHHCTSSPGQRNVKEAALFCERIRIPIGHDETKDWVVSHGAGEAAATLHAHHRWQDHVVSLGTLGAMYA